MVTVDNRIEELGGIVFRRWRSEVADEQYLREAEAFKHAVGKAVLAESVVAPMRGTVVGSDLIRYPSEPLDREAYAHFDTNPVQLVAESPVSTFSIDVDSASYANVRRLLNQGVLYVEQIQTHFFSKFTL